MSARTAQRQVMNVYDGSDPEDANSAVTGEMTTERSGPAANDFYDAAYDAENETAGIMLFGGGGAGNRTRVREASS